MRLLRHRQRSETAQGSAKDKSLPDGWPPLAPNVLLPGSLLSTVQGHK